MTFRIVLIYVLLTGCSARNNHEVTTTKTHYPDDKIRSISKYSDSSLISFVNLNIQGDTICLVEYNESLSMQRINGLPLIHVVWSKHKYRVGDTLEVFLDIARIPKVDIELQVLGSNSTKLDTIDNPTVGKMTKIEMELVNTSDSLQVRGVMRVENEKWVTFHRTLKIYFAEGLGFWQCSKWVMYQLC